MPYNRGEFFEADLKVSLLADNAAAISAFHPSMGSWRNRHLRMRAQSGREKIESGFLTVNYVPGGLRVADIGTKALSSSKLLGLLDLVNVRMPSREASEVVAAKAFGRLAATAKGPIPSKPSALWMALLVASQLPEAKAMGPLEWMLSGVIWGVARAQPELELTSSWVVESCYGGWYGCLVSRFGIRRFLRGHGCGRRNSMAAG